MNIEEPKVVLITGANRGIGLETARQLGRRAFHVVIAARDNHAAATAADSITKAGGKASGIAMDVTDPTSIRDAVGHFGKLADRLDVLINNAGIYPDEGLSILTVARERLVGTFQTNTFGPVEVTQAFLPSLRKSKSPRVINVSSGYGQLDGLSAQVPSYCLSKLALNGVTIMLAAALKPTGWRSIQCVQAGCARIWAVQTHRARWKKAPTRQYGWPPKRLRRRRASSSAIERKSSGDSARVSGGAVV